MAFRGFTDTQIEAFMWVFKTQSATSAAEKMLVSQPAISRLLKQLEHHLGFALFERVNNRLLATRRGQLFFHEVERVYVGHRHLKQFAERLQNTAAGKFSVASMPSLAVALLPSLALSLEQLHPELQISLYAYRSNQLCDDMLAQRFDCAITSDLRRDDRFQSFFYQIPCVALLPAGHKLAAKGCIDIDDLDGQTLISGEPEEASFQQLMHLLDEAMVVPSKVWHVSLSEMAIQLTLSGAGIAVINQISANHVQAKDIIIKPFSAPLSYQVQLILPLERNIDPSVAAVINDFKAQFEQQIAVSAVSK